MIRGAFKIGFLAMLASATAHVARADTIQLRSSARASAPVSLRDVAILEGADAEALGDVIVFEQSKEARAAHVDLSVDEIRSLLNESRTDIRWGKIALSGDSCSLRLICEKKETPAAEVPPTPVRAAPVPKAAMGPTWNVVSEMRDESLRSAIGARIVSFLKAESSDVRVAFSEADSTLLSTPTPGRTLDIQPTGLGSMVPVMVRVFEADKVIAAGTAKVRVEQKLNVVGATRSLHRGDLVTKEVVFSESRWTTPGERLATEEAILGRVVKNRVQPGELFLDGDVEAAILVKRGDIVNIACVAGSIVMNTKARAMANAGENEVIEFTPLRNPKSRVTARVVAPGQAVISADGGGDDSVFQNKPVAEAEPSPTGKRVAAVPTGPTSTFAPAVKGPELATVGSTTVQRITTKPDGTFVVEAATKDPKKPIRKMKFIPLDEP
ncbi:MAG: flagellar basal body P-ring formation protein FlgA [Phycisphaerales bacterium]|nr:flagellar basal body P-ring formation protein FlgA [Phycisphaerales bacterium]